MSIGGKKHHRSLLFLLVVLVGALVGACGVDDPSGKTTQTVSGIVSGSTATVGMKLCTSCHSARTEDWLTSKHANVDPIGNLYSAGNPTFGQIYTNGVYTDPVTVPSTCKNCHDPNRDSGQLVAGYTGNTVRPVVGCESCHGGGDVHYAGGGAGYIGFAAVPGSTVTGPSGTLQLSAQFNTCTTCHELLDATDPAGTVPAIADHITTLPTGSDYVITDTHFATSGDWSVPSPGSANIKDITGYAMDFSSEKVCTNCHNPHKAPDKNREWAQSAHGDMNAAVTDYWSGAWAHYNWSCDGVPASGCGSSRMACQRCHTTSGFAAYANALRSGDKQTADNINNGLVSLIASTSGWKPEMLQCWGCHTDNKGTRRNPGQRTTDYGYVASGKTYAIASYTYPDVGDSNICMTCHTGRENGDTLMGLNDAALLSAGTTTFFDFSNNSFINSHYLTGGGTVFTATGFEFPSRNYENLASYRHNQIGSSFLPFTGSGGPCVGCHMSRPGGDGDHFFMPVTRSKTAIGHIDSIASEICIYCHTVSGAGGLEDLINERKDEYHEAIEATIHVLDERGHYFKPAHPYFYDKRISGTVNGSIAGTTVPLVSTATVSITDYFKMDRDGKYYGITVVNPGSITLDAIYTSAATTGSFVIIKPGGVKNWLTQAGTGITSAAATDTDTSGNTTGRYNMGAAFNLNLIEHEPGAYVHNRIYAKRLLYDAIDWADDNQMNFSAGATLRDLKIDSMDPVWKLGAMKWLLPNGVLGISAERP